MYWFSCLAPEEGIWSPPQPLTYIYVPSPLLLPPIQAHNFCSRPPALRARDWITPREYHCFHGPGAFPGTASPWWAFPQAYATALGPPYPVPGFPEPSRQAPAAQRTAAADSWAPWPEGSSLQAELRWGRVERALGPRRELPDFVLRELRRVYGTYPRTDVRVTFRGGEFLLQATPRIGEAEYRAQRRLPPSPTSSGSGDSIPTREAAERGRRQKRKGLG